MTLLSLWVVFCNSTEHFSNRDNTIIKPVECWIRRCNNIKIKYSGGLYESDHIKIFTFYANILV